jgi:hypothetical protein
LWIDEVVIFQHACAPPHYGNIFCDALHMRFPGQCIQQEGLVPWPPRSPDLMPLTFFLWCYMKSVNHGSTGQVNDVEELKHQITAAAATVTPEMFKTCVE